MTEQAASASTGTPPAGSQPPPYTGSGFPLRHGLVRPRHGRYLAGVCAAIGRATNTDPVLWRVLLAVLGFFGGIGLLVYVAVWLATPAEGDSASPVEALLGRGRSGTSPIVVIILGMVVALMFGFIVTDGFRAALLGAAVLIGGALLLNRNTGGSGPTPAAPAAGPGPGPGDAPTAPVPPVPPRPTDAPPAPPAPAAGPGLADDTRVDDAVDDPTLSAPSTAPASAAPPQPVWPSPAGQAPPPPFPAPRPFPPPPPPGPSGYRPPFAPYGPYGPGPGGVPPGPPPPPPPPPPPKPPRERSGLGAGTFSLIFVALGVVAALDLSDAVRVGPPAYFAAALITVALGLLVGAWFGRARWLIALGLALSVALGIATAAAAVNPDDGNFGADVTWRPSTVDAIANRYENNFGNAVLDLSQVSFAGRDQRIAVEVNFGALEVILPPTVDVTAAVKVSAGDATVFNDQWGGFDNTNNEVTDLGSDGSGGGRLRLDVEVNAGNVEVHR